MQTAERQHVGSSADGIDLAQLAGHGRLIAQRHGRQHGILVFVGSHLPVTFQKLVTVTEEMQAQPPAQRDILPRRLQPLPVTGTDERLTGEAVNLLVLAVVERSLPPVTVAPDARGQLQTVTNRQPPAGRILGHIALHLPSAAGNHHVHAHTLRPLGDFRHDHTLIADVAVGPRHFAMRLADHRRAKSP